MQSWIFSIITLVFSVTWSFRNHDLLFSMLKTVVLLNILGRTTPYKHDIILETVIHINPVHEKNLQATFQYQKISLKMSVRFTCR